LGGHDHLYLISKGVTAWEGYDISKPRIGAEGDNGDILVIKRGTDFRELSELTLELTDTPPGGVRKKIIQAVLGECSWLFTLNRVSDPPWYPGKRHEITSRMSSSKNLQEILHQVLSSLSESMSKPVCITEVELDLRSPFIRTEEVCRLVYLVKISYSPLADGSRELVRRRFETRI
jgi:5'-nucleotidase